MRQNHYRKIREKIPQKFKLAVKIGKKKKAAFLELRRITRVLKFVYFYVEFPLQPFAFFCPFFIGITDFYDKKMTSIFVAIYRDASLSAKRVRPPYFLPKCMVRNTPPP